MNTLITLTDQDFTPDAPVGDRDTYYFRQAARAVVTDSDGAIAIMHAQNLGYYKLPGGGVDEGEEIIDALHREIMEEVGVKITVTGELGIVDEYRDFVPMHQVSYAYIATVKGEKGAPSYTAKELAAGFEIIWAESIDAALGLVRVSQDSADPMGGTFMQRRDITILEAAKQIL